MKRYKRMVPGILFTALMLIGGWAFDGFAASSAVVTADGYACMGVDKSQRQNGAGGQGRCQAQRRRKRPDAGEKPDDS